MIAEVIILRKLCNKTKLKILDALKEKDLSISELSRYVGVGYKCVYLHIKSLEQLCLIERNPKGESQGKEVIISLNKSPHVK